MKTIKTLIDPILAKLSGVKYAPPTAPPLETRLPYDRRTPLLSFGPGQDWTLNDACQGVQIFGGTGSGKTSGSGASLALSYLRNGFGGLVLTAKPDDVVWWLYYSKMTGRMIKVFGPGRGLRFNFMDYEVSRGGLGAGLTSNIAELFTAIAEVIQGKNGTMEAYWVNALNQLLCRAIDLLLMAKEKLSLPTLLKLIMSAPQSLDEAQSETWKKESFCAKCIRRAEKNQAEINSRDLEHTMRYWSREFACLGDRTRSGIVSMFTVLADGFVTGPIGELFCTSTNVVPEETHLGEIILVHLPIEVYNRVGIYAQAVWKFTWQRATARREPSKDGGIPTFLWADEAQFFASESDLKFQATARSKKACTVFLTQNLSSYFDRIGQDKTNALLGNLQTKIFHANGDHVTNTYAADTIARSVISRSNTSISPTGISFGTSEAVDYTVPPAEFQRLRKGGIENDRIVDAFVFQAGRIWPSNGESYIKASFKQPNQTI